MTQPQAPSGEESQQNVASANCAGQGCPERGQCRRYRVIVTKSGLSRDFMYRDTLGHWKSFDIERQAFGSCSAFSRYQVPR